MQPFRIKKDEVRIGPELTGAITGSIRPFAQHEMVDRFMEGIDGIYRKFVEDKVWALVVDGDAAGTTAQPLGMALHHAGRQRLTQTIEFPGSDGVLKARQRGLRRQ